MLQNNYNSVSNIPVELLPELVRIFEQYSANKNQEKLAGKKLTEFVYEYLAFVEAHRSYKYFLSSKVSFNHLIKFLGSEIRLNDITVRDVDLLLTSLKKSAPKGFLVYFRTLKSAFSKAQVWGYISKNPFKEIKPEKLQKNKITVINENDLKIVLLNIKNITVRMIVETSFCTGCRLSEVINLRVRSLDITERSLRIGDEDFDTKSKKERIIPLPDNLFNLLRPLILDRNEDDFLFTKTNGFPYSADYISKSFKKAIRKAEMDEKLHFHSLRHSYASRLAARGASSYCLRDLLGHSSVSVTELYTHTNLDDLRKTVNLLNNAPLK